MFDRFRQKYPQGSITSSLIQIHNDQYIVSVSIKVDGVVLATTLAADEQIQVAEAQATAQAIQTLHLGEPGLTNFPIPQVPTLERVSSEVGNKSEPIASATDIAEITAVSAASEPQPQSIYRQKETVAIVQEEQEDTTYQVSTVSPAEPSLSVTDMIPLINMELKRLSWSREKGRDCIVELYNKRSSSLLSDEELLGLLRYLQAQPAHDEERND